MHIMTPSKNLIKAYVTSFSIVWLLCAWVTVGLQAQDSVNLRLSAAATAGYAPIVTHGSTESSGLVVGVYGELEYGKAIGRLQFTKPLVGTFDENKLDNGESYHGSLGYRLDLTDQFSIGLMASGGATVIHYSTGFNGGGGDNFTNVSPQVGVVIAPTYQLSQSFSLQAGVRYYKGFEAGDRGRASDLADISVALRFSIGG